MTIKLFKPQWAREWSALIKQDGLRGFIKKKGWKFLVAFFVFYLVRDITLYIIIPYLALSSGFLRCS